MSTKSNSRKPKKEKRGLPAAAVVIIVVILLLIAAAAFGIYYLLNLYQPDYRAPVDTDLVGDETTDENGEYDPELVRKEGIYNFLILGKDVGGTNTDVFMLASFQTQTDGAEPYITLMQIPRDTYLEYNQRRDKKINSLYAFISNTHRREDGLSGDELLDTSMREVCTVLSHDMKIAIDHYVIMDLQGFRNIVDCLGGVYMYVPCDMEYTDEAQDLYINLKKGYQTLDGAKAEQFIRFRKGFKLGDLSRVEAQKLFMTALIRQVRSQLSVGTVANIAEELYRYMNTSMTLPELSFFAKEFFKVDDSRIYMLTCPGSCPEGSPYYVVSRDEMRYTVNRFFNVYKVDVEDEMFDVEYAFINEDDTAAMAIYSRQFDPQTGNGGVHSVDDIAENGIPLY